jgi:hypothetical protein
MKSNKLIIVVVLSLIFASCDKDNELENKELSGKEVPVRIRSLSVAPSGSENLTRSVLQKEPEMSATPVGDGMLMEMSVKENESPLRATALLGEGKLFRVIAVEHETNTYYSHGDFTVGINGPSPSTDFHVKVDEKYDYICISYNSDTDLPDDADYEVGEDLDDEFDVDNTNDLLWCRINKAEKVTASGVDLEILLVQKLSKVTVIIDCSYNDWGIKSIATSKVGIMGIPLTCSIDWSDGTLSETETEQWLTFDPPTPSPTPPTYPPTLTSNELRLIPTTSNATINFEIGAILRDGFATAVPAAQSSFTFIIPLSAGVNYTITIRLRTPIFARSNIYWTGGAMTFVPAGSSDTSKDGYQGLFFKWGSLVGIAPTVDWVNNSTRVYKAGASTYSTYPTWDDIPFESSTTMGDPDLNTFKGDICKYINSAYRLPVYGEFGTIGGWHQNWEKDLDVAVGFRTDKVDGTYNFVTSLGKGYATNTVMGNVIFPASGNFNHYGLCQNNVGSQGKYWTSSAAGTTTRYYLYFSSSTIGESFSIGELAYPIRCVKKVDPTGSY